MTDWLRNADGRPSFVVTPSMLLPRLRSSARRPKHAGAREFASALQSDAWCGYPGSLHAVLALLCREQIEGIVFLSGDAHLSCVARATVADNRGHSVVLHSVHSSALYAPYRFANAAEADFAAPDAWDFADALDPTVVYSVTVTVERWAPGDGFASVRVVPEASAGGSMEVSFDRDLKTPPVEPVTITFPARRA